MQRPIFSAKKNAMSDSKTSYNALQCSVDSYQMTLNKTDNKEKVDIQENGKADTNQIPSQNS